MGWLDDALRTAGHPLAPEVEARDANSQLFAHVLHGLSQRDLDPPDEVMAFLGRMQSDPSLLAKAVTLNPMREQLAYPDGYAGHRRDAILYANELGIHGQFEPWAERDAYGSGFDLLRQVAQVDVVQAIIRTCVNAIVPYVREYRDDDNNPLGMRLVRRDRERLTKADDKKIARVWERLNNSGNESDPIARKWDARRAAFPAFITKLLADSLTYDWCPIFMERARNGSILGWQNLDPTTVRLAYESGYQGNDRIVALQINPQDRHAEVGFEADEILCEVRNPRSSLWQYDYGSSELEHYLRACTFYLNSMTFAGAALDRNTMPRGFLTVFGDFDNKQLVDFKQRWAAQMLGVSKRWAMPVMVSKNKEAAATWTSVDTASSEPLYTKLVSLSISIACALWGTTPELINCESFSSKTSSLSGDSTSEKLESAHNRGHVPRVLWVLRQINEGILAAIPEAAAYEMTVVGLFPDDEKRKHERQMASSTIDELRAIDGEDPHPDPDIGAAPANANLMGIYQTKLSQKLGIAMPGSAQADQQQGKPGEDDDDGEKRPDPREFLQRSDAPPERELAKAATPGRLVVEIRRLDLDEAAPC